MNRPEKFTTGGPRLVFSGHNFSRDISDLVSEQLALLRSIVRLGARATESQAAPIAQHCLLPR